MQDKNKLRLNSSPLSISFATSKSNGQNYRGISDSKSSSSICLQNAAHSIQPITFIPQQQQQSKSFSMIQFDLNTNFPKSKALQTLPKTLDILTTPIAIENEYEHSISVSCTSPLNLNAPQSLVENATQFKYCNELNSYLVENSNSHQVLKMLDNILSTNFKEIDFKIDYENKLIHGLVFMASYSVFFTIYVWSEADHVQFEFRRTSGDALASAKLWAQIKGYYTHIMQNKNGQLNENEFKFELDFIELNMPNMNGMDLNTETESQNGLDKMQMDSLMESLMNNDLFVVDELNFLYESMIGNQTIAMDILSNKFLMRQLINESLLNKDICVCRIVLLILEELSKMNQNFMVNQNDLKLFDHINLLLNHKRNLIKTYTIRLLANLSLTKKKWIINTNAKKNMIENVKKYEDACTNKSYYDMIQNINEKLLMN